MPSNLVALGRPPKLVFESGHVFIFQSLSLFYWYAKSNFGRQSVSNSLQVNNDGIDFPAVPRPRKSLDYTQESYAHTQSTY